MKGTNAYAVARAMLILGGRNSPTRIGRQLGAQREAVSYWLNRMREERLADRQARTTSGGGYEWWLTEKGQAFAIYTRPDTTDTRPLENRYDHRGLAEAMGMVHQITPPAGRVHILEGGR